MQEQVYEYFNNYFDGTLNESTTNAEIMDAVYDLVYLTEAVLEAISPEDKLERSKYNLGKDQVLQPSTEKGDKRIRKRRKVVDARKAKEIKKANQKYFNTTKGTDADYKDRELTFRKIKNMNSLRKGWQDATK